MGEGKQRHSQRGGDAPQARKTSVRAVLNTHLCLNLEDLGSGTALALRAKFTHDDPKFHKARAMGLWTGDMPAKIKSWKLEDGWLMLPRGASGDVQRFLMERGMGLEPVWDRTVEHAKINLELKKELYPFQKRAVDDLIKTTGGIVRGPCGSGKTIMLIGAIARLGQPTLVIVHTGRLMQQWRAALANWLGITAGTIGGGNAENIRAITVAMQQTLWRQSVRAPWADQFGLIVIDECHHTPASSYNAVAEMFPARWRWGCTATIKRKDGKQFLLHETVGPIAHEITKEELLELDRLVPVRMEVVPTGFEDEEYMASRECGEMPDWGGMIGRLVENEDRNALILEKVREVVAQRSTRVLLLNERVEACHGWAARLRSVGIKAGLIVGGDENKTEMERTIDGLCSGKVRVAVGTMASNSPAAEGLDVQQLTHVFVTCPVHQHPERLAQIIGRAARKWKRKKEGVAVYLWDRRMFGIGSEKRFLRKLGKVCSGLEVVQ